jgi:hypothetical protein
MAKRVARLKVWFDEEGKGSFRSIGPDIYEHVDVKGKVIGFCDLQFHEARPQNGGNSPGREQGRCRTIDGG